MMIRKFGAIFFFLFLALCQLNCAFFLRPDTAPGAAEYNEITKIPRDNEAERIAAFNRYRVEKQIDVYLLAARRSRHEFGNYLRIGGEGKILKLAGAIKTKDLPMDKGYLIGQINDIDRNCNCVSTNPQVMEILKLSEPAPDPNDDEGDRAWKQSYSSVLFELQRKALIEKDDKKIQNMPNPYSNANVAPAR